MKEVASDTLTSSAQPSRRQIPHDPKICERASLSAGDVVTSANPEQIAPSAGRARPESAS